MMSTPRLRLANIWQAMWAETHYDPEHDPEPEDVDYRPAAPRTRKRHSREMVRRAQCRQRRRQRLERERLSRHDIPGVPPEKRGQWAKDPRPHKTPYRCRCPRCQKARQLMQKGNRP